MTWVAVGMAALGVVQGDRKEQKAIKDMEYKAELMKYSPYNKTAASIAGTPTEDMSGKSLEMGLGGAANGIATSGALKKAGYMGGGTPETAKLDIPAPGMGPDGKPLSLEEQQKYNLLAQQQMGRLNA